MSHDRMSEHAQHVAEDQAKAKAKKSGWDGVPIPFSELNAQRKVDHDPEIKIWVNRINKHLREKGLGATMDLAKHGDLSGVVKEEVISRFGGAGYRLEFGSDQRDYRSGWIKVKRKADG